MGPYYDHQVGRFEPLDPVLDRDLLLARARRVRAEAMGAMLVALWRRLTSGVAAPRRRAGRLTASCN